MPKITREEVRVPADVMPEARDEYITNYLKATRETGRLMLFACDQKIEHLNKDFYGEGIDIADAEPQHLFEIGRQGVCGVLAGQRGLIAQYAADYPEINYLVKMNSKTNIVGGSQDDPYSPQLYDLDAVLAMREAGVNIVGIGYTIYLGSEYESTMMAEAGELIAQAHANGLLVVLWIYPRGKAVKAEKDPALIAGAAGVALLGRWGLSVLYPTTPEILNYAGLLQPLVAATVLTVAATVLCNLLTIARAMKGLIVGCLAGLGAALLASPGLIGAYAAWGTAYATILGVGVQALCLLACLLLRCKKQFAAV